MYTTYFPHIYIFKQHILKEPSCKRKYMKKTESDFQAIENRVDVESKVLS